MKRLYTFILALVSPLMMIAQGWPSDYSGVMLQGFYWDSYADTKWTNLESEADELSQYFNLVWIPQSASCNGTSMGYDDLYWFTNYNSSFGTEAELRSLISTFKNKGIGTIADVVINHRKNVSNWVDFPAETYKGVTYQLQSTDICADDDGGATKTWATTNGYSLSSSNDTGEGWSGMRDLDHNSSNVQTNVKAYLNMLLNDLGYVGFRYDMVKGYSGSFTGIYNSYANPTYSVGEYWDGNVSTVESWLNATKVNSKIQSAAFDFPFRYTVRDAINNSNWSKLANASLMSDANYRQYAVTFVENHDTEYRSSSEQQDPIKKDTVAANAFMLAMPGTPCIFYKHWQANKSEIGPMIKIRKAVGITNTSSTSVISSSSAYFEAKTTGTNGDLYVVIGDITKGTIPSGYTKVLSGTKYAYYANVSINMVTVSKSTGTYDNSVTSTINALGNSTYVYTTDGSTPTATNGTQGTGSKELTFTTTTTLKVGVLVSGTVSDVQTYTYTVNAFTPHTATVYLKDPSWTKVCFYAWDDSGTLNGSWPGNQVIDTKVVNGITFYYKTFNITSSSYTFSIIFDQGSNAEQTVDIGPLNSDKYYEISSTTSKFTVNDITSSYPTGIENITTEDSKTYDKVNVYSVDGRLLRSMPKATTMSEALNGLSQGLYIVNDKKVVNK